MVTCLILDYFRSFFEGAHQFWASIAEGVGGVVNQKVIEHEAHKRINNGKTDAHAYN